MTHNNNLVQLQHAKIKETEALLRFYWGFRIVEQKGLSPLSISGLFNS
jgi:hypothetical protein